MAKTEKTQTEVTLSSETKRYLRNLTKALEKVARGMAMYRVVEPPNTPKRLSEPAEDTTVVDPQWQEELNRGNQVELDPASIQNLPQSIMNQESYLQ